MREISLSREIVAFIDDDDYETVSQHSWHVLVVRDHMYAKSNTYGLMHHLIMGKPEEGFVVDHINDDGLDNRRANLRFLTNAENIRRSPKYREDAGIQYMDGYPKLKKPWRAEVSIHGKGKHLGYFATKEEAMEARRSFLAEADK